MVNKTKELCVINTTKKIPSGAMVLETVEDFRAGNVTSNFEEA